MLRQGSTLVVAFALGVISACSSGDATHDGDEGSDGAATIEDATWSVAEVAPSVEFFGDLAVVRSAPVTTTFGASAASLELDDGVTVDVPAGAFDAPTEVTAVIVDLDFAQFADNAPHAAAYVLATETDLDLAAPAVLDVAEPPESVTVMQPIDGEWRVVNVPAGQTTRVPITHFSEVPTVVVKAGMSNAAIRGSDPDGEAPGDFMTACLYTVTLLLADDTDASGSQDISLALPLAYSFCARALVTKFSPSGVRVEVGCVGDKIGGDIDFRAAIDACAAEVDAPSVLEAEPTPSSVDIEVGAEPEQIPATDGRYAGSLDNPGVFVDVEVGDNSLEVVVEGGSVTEFALRFSGRYSACFGGYGDEDEVSCTVWVTSDFTLSGGPVPVSEGSADVPVTSSQAYKDCESELASECEDWDYTDVEEGTMRIAITEGIMTGSFLFEGKVIEGAGFTASRQ